MASYCPTCGQESLVGLKDTEERRHARSALKSYMEEWSESHYAAGWLYGLAETMSSDETYQWLVRRAGGTFDDSENFVEVTL